MQGFAFQWVQTEEHANGKVETTDGNWYHIRAEQVELDSIGRCYLKIGEPVTFDEGPDIITKGRGRRIRQAVNVRRPHRVRDIDPRGHREICEVLNENYLLRQLGGRLTINRDDVPPEGLSSGNIVSCGVRDEGYHTWRATDILWLAPDEESYSGPWEL